jgi:hypothetical protein
MLLSAGDDDDNAADDEKVKKRPALQESTSFSPSAKVLPTVFHVVVGKESVDKDIFADGHVSGHRQSLAEGRASCRRRGRQPSRDGCLCRWLTGWPSAKFFFVFLCRRFLKIPSGKNFFIFFAQKCLCRQSAVGKVMVTLPTAALAVSKAGSF